MITSANNPQIKNVILLNTKGKARREQDLFVAEGVKMFLEAPVPSVEKVYVSDSFYQKTIHRSKIEKLPFEVVADDIFMKMSDTKTPQGILTVMKQFHYSEDELLQKENALFLVLEGIQDPGNLGTMLRTGEGAGVTAIFADKNTADLYNPKVIRSTMGSVYRVPFLVSDSLSRLVTRMKEHHVCVYAAHLLGEKSFDEESYSEGTAFLIGNEGNGLTEETAALADSYIKIPMCGKVESLNAAVAASLLLYSAKRYL